MTTPRSHQHSLAWLLLLTAALGFVLSRVSQVPIAIAIVVVAVATFGLYMLDGWFQKNSAGHIAFQIGHAIIVRCAGAAAGVLAGAGVAFVIAGVLQTYGGETAQVPLKTALACGAAVGAALGAAFPRVAINIASIVLLPFGGL